jgi:hypothetical protein
MGFRLKTSGRHLCKHRNTFKVFSLELCRPHHLGVATLLIPKIAHAFLKFYIFAFVDGCHNCNWVKKVNFFVESHSRVLEFIGILGLGVMPFLCNYRNILNRMVGTARRAVRRSPLARRPYPIAAVSAPGPARLHHQQPVKKLRFDVAADMRRRNSSGNHNVMSASLPRRLLCKQAATVKARRSPKHLSNTVPCGCRRVRRFSPAETYLLNRKLVKS